MLSPARWIGRPAGEAYPITQQIRPGTAGAEALAALAEAWRCSEAAAVRRAIQEAAKRELTEVAR